MLDDDKKLFFESDDKTLMLIHLTNAWWWNRVIGGSLFTIYVYSGVIGELKVDKSSIKYKWSTFIIDSIPDNTSFAFVIVDHEEHLKFKLVEKYRSMQLVCYFFI